MVWKANSDEHMTIMTQLCSFKACTFTGDSRDGGV